MDNGLAENNGIFQNPFNMNNFYSDDALICAGPNEVIDAYNRLNIDEQKLLRDKVASDYEPGYDEGTGSCHTRSFEIADDKFIYLKYTLKCTTGINDAWSNTRQLIARISELEICQ